MPAAPGEVGTSMGQGASGRNDRARAALPPRPCSQLCKPFFISWHLFLKALWPSLLKPKAATPGRGGFPGGTRAGACRRRVQLLLQLTQSPLRNPMLLTLGKLSPATGIGAHPKMKKLGRLPRRVLPLSPRSL